MMSFRNSTERSSVAVGCMLGLASALLTSFMLFINGSFVMAILSSIARRGPSWAANPSFSQFLLFTVPLFMTIAEWMMIDYVRTRVLTRPMDVASDELDN